MKTSYIKGSVCALGMAVAVVLGSCRKTEAVVPTTAATTTFDASERKVPVVPSILEVPEGNSICYRTYASGVQIYVVTATSTGYAWVFRAPEAELFANEGLTGLVGTHYAGPTWESNSGSKVVAARLQGVNSPEAGAIPWLLLGAVSTSGPGIFKNVTYIQRINTSGGLAPTIGADASHVGEVARVPYTAEYVFYRVD